MSATTELLCAVLNTLRQLHGDRMLCQEDFNFLVEHLGEIEGRFSGLPLNEVKHETEAEAELPPWEDPSCPE